MSNIHGAVLLGQIRRVEEIVGERIIRAEKYDALLKNIDNISDLNTWKQANVDAMGTLTVEDKQAVTTKFDEM